MHDAENLAATADVAGAMSLEAMQGVPPRWTRAFTPSRPYAGQITVAANLRALIEGSVLCVGSNRDASRPGPRRLLPSLHATGARRRAGCHCLRAPGGEHRAQLRHR